MQKLNLWLPSVLIVFVGFALALGGTSTLEDLLLEPMRQSASTAGAALEGELTLDSALSVDAAAERANRASVRELFRSGGANKGERQELREILAEPVEGRLGKPDFAWIADVDGRVLVSHVKKTTKDKEPAVDTKKVAGFTGFADSLRGVARDGVLLFEKNAFRFASVPVYDDTQPRGVLMLGWSIDSDYAKSLSEKLHAEVVFVINEDRVGEQINIAPGKPVPAGKLKKIGAGQPFGKLSAKMILPLPIEMPLLVGNNGRFVGERRAIYRAEKRVSAVVAIDRARSLVALANTQIIILLVSLIFAVVFLVMSLAAQRAQQRPLGIVLDHLSDFAQGATTDLLPEEELSGGFLRLGKQINMILKGQVAGGKSASASSAPVQPRSAPPAGGGGAGAKPLDFEGFAQQNPAPTPPPIGDVIAGGAAPPPVPSSDGEEGALSGLFQDNADPLAAFRVPQKPPASPPPAPEFSLDDEAGSSNATAAFHPPQELLAASNPGSATPPVAVPPPPPPEAQTSGATVVAQVPKELLQASGAAAPASTQPATDAMDPEQIHFRQIFQEFMQTRQECGEDVSELTYERFETKLLKTKQTIMDKYNPSSVRFQVYVKQGKAALRAVPVRD